MKCKLRNRFVSKWKEFEGDVRTRWGKLSSKDFQWIAGQQDKLIRRVQERYDLAEDEAQRQVNEWITQLRF
jgi:uncharacterized protein YjbJ (UPF0337 family)